MDPSALATRSLVIETKEITTKLCTSFYIVVSMVFFLFLLLYIQPMLAMGFYPINILCLQLPLWPTFFWCYYNFLVTTLITALVLKKNRKWKVKELAPSFRNKPKVLVVLFTWICQAYFLVPTYKNLNFLNCFTIRLQTRHRYLNQQRDESSH